MRPLPRPNSLTRKLALIVAIPLTLALALPMTALRSGAQSEASLPDTSTGVHLGLAYNNWLAYSNQGTAPEVGVFDYVFGAVANNSGANIPAQGVDHTFYLPLGRTNSDVNLAWMQANHPDWIVYAADRTTPAWYPGDAGGHPPIDFTNPAVQDWYISNYIRPALTTGGYQGVAFDQGQTDNWSARAGVYNSNGQWVQQYNGDDLDTAYRQASITAFQQIVAKIRAIKADAIISINDSVPTWTGQSSDQAGATALNYWRDLIPYVDIVWDECGYTVCSGYGNYLTTNPLGSGDMSDPWLAETQNLSWAASQGKGVMVGTYEPYTVTNNLTTSNSQARNDLSWNLANYLLVKGIHTWFAWRGNNEVYGDNYWQPEYNKADQIGSPTGTMYSAQSVYMRQYTNGLAIVNPSDSSSHTVSLPTGYTDLYGNAVRTYTLPVHSGLVLLGAAQTATSTPTSTVTATNTPTATSTSTATNTPAPTGTTPPTATRVPASATPTTAPATPTSTPTSSATARPSATSTPATPTSVPPTPAPTASPVGVGSGGQLVVNGGFENGITGWGQVSGSRYLLVDSQKPHTGQYSAHLCGYSNCADHLAQYLVVPTHLSQVTLSYWVYVGSASGRANTCQDGLTVQVRTPAGIPVAMGPSICSRQADGLWHRITMDATDALSPYGGRVVQLYVQGWTGASGTHFFVDDITLTTVKGTF